MNYNGIDILSENFARLLPGEFKFEELMAEEERESEEGVKLAIGDGDMASMVELFAELVDDMKVMEPSVFSGLGEEMMVEFAIRM